MTPSKDDVEESVVDGLTTFAQMTGSTDLARGGSILYRDVRAAVRPLVDPAEACTLAFPSMVVEPTTRVECLVLVYPSRVVVAWRRGFMRKTTETVVLARDSIRGARVVEGTDRATAGATLLVVDADRTVTVGLPKGRPELAQTLAAAVHPGA